MPRNNKDKTPPDETILEETPPNINEPQKDEEVVETEEEKKEDVVGEGETVSEDEVEESETLPEEKAETQDQRDQRYKEQQTEAQIQAAKNRALIDKVDEATKVGEPTLEELKSFVATDGVQWDELTTFEQAMAKKSYLAEKRFNLVNEAVQSTKKIDEWATKVDEFIDSTDSKPEFIKLSGHESDFRKFAMKEAHRSTPIDILYKAFIGDLPAPTKKRGSLFESKGGGEKSETVGVITDVDEAANLRATRPREYKRRLKAGTIKVEV